jgi:hypothetical protein
MSFPSGLLDNFLIQPSMAVASEPGSALLRSGVHAILSST